ncbi:hypothetical protein JKF63_00646 [Porcisia hertigi]|uniref:Uncharacterized protein n=1 Tax=Porcisia hertigi TaxID=2761500 RepID=A0A836I5A5_9TRYP|nr:hypothetical protein JKF63_00646 [Porcisia hertigi]
MPAKRQASSTRSRKGRSASRSRTPARSRNHSGGSKNSPSKASSPVAEERKETPTVSMWDADAKLMTAMRRRNSRGKCGFFGQQRVQKWGYWAAIITFQVLLIIWIKWAVDMYLTYKASH